MRSLAPAFAALIAATAAPAQNAPAPAMDPLSAPLAQQRPPAELAALLRRGGYVLLMRHTNSPQSRPDAASAEPGNQGAERQLDAQGHADAKAFGAAIRRLGIRLGAVYTSPTWRARSMLADAGVTGPQALSWLDVPPPAQRAPAAGAMAALLAQKPAPGTDTLIVTHQPNVAGVFPDAVKGLGEGDLLVVRPLAPDRYELVGAIQIGAWSALRR